MSIPINSGSPARAAVWACKPPRPIPSSHQPRNAPWAGRGYEMQRNRASAPARIVHGFYTPTSGNVKFRGLRSSDFQFRHLRVSMATRLGHLKRLQRGEPPFERVHAIHCRRDAERDQRIPSPAFACLCTRSAMPGFDRQRVAAGPRNALTSPPPGGGADRPRPACR